MAFSILHVLLLNIFGIYSEVSLFSYLESEDLNRQNAQFIIGGLFPLRISSKSQARYSSCCNGSLDIGTFQEAIAMQYAIEKINKDHALLPGIKMASDIRNTCNNLDTAIRQCLDFDFVRRYYLNVMLDSNTGGYNAIRKSPKTIAVIGTRTSGISHGISTLTNIFEVPLISYYSTSPILSNSYRFKSFIRTVPNDTLFAKALVDLLIKVNWNFIFVILTNTDYAASAYNAFRSRIKKMKLEQNQSSICIAKTYFSKRNLFNELFSDMRKYPEASGILVFAHSVDAAQILKAAMEKNYAKYYWIFSDGIKVTPALCSDEKWENALQRTVSVMFYSRNVNDYVDYLTDYLTNNTFLSDEIGSIENVTSKISTNIPYVIDAVMAVAHGLHAALSCSKSKCNNASSFEQR